MIAAIVLAVAVLAFAAGGAWERRRMRRAFAAFTALGSALMEARAQQYPDFEKGTLN